MTQLNVAHQKGFRSGYTQSQLIKKWVYAVYLRIPSTTPLPDMDYTHSDSGQESQAKTVPPATAEDIQGLTSYPENFLFRGHRKCTDSVHLSVV